MVGAHQRRAAGVVGLGFGELVQTLRQTLGQATAVDEDQRRAVGADQLQQARIDRRPDRVARFGALVGRPAPSRPSAAQPPLEAGLAMSSTGTTTCRSSALRLPTSTSVTWRSDAAQKTADLVQRALRRRQADALHRASATWSSRSRDSARCAPRLVPATEWISSTMTQRTDC